jgi:type IV secretory pathway ATPase VirB11/archaellum biosynthesis ATPase
MEKVQAVISDDSKDDKEEPEAYEDNDIKSDSEDKESSSITDTLNDYLSDEDDVDSGTPEDSVEDNEEVELEEDEDNNIKSDSEDKESSSIIDTLNDYLSSEGDVDSGTSESSVEDNEEVELEENEDNDIVEKVKSVLFDSTEDTTSDGNESDSETDNIIESIKSKLINQNGEDGDQTTGEDLKNQENISDEDSITDNSEIEKPDIQEEDNNSTENKQKINSEDDQKSTEPSLVDKITLFFSSDIADVDQERPDARNVAIDFVSESDETGFWSSTMTKFWSKLRRARQGETEAVKDINADLWPRYKALLRYNSYARGDFLDLIFGMSLVVFGFILISIGLISSLLGDVIILDVLTQESAYADHIFLTTIILFIIGLSLWLSRRINSKTAVSAIRKPARSIEMFLVILQFTVVAVVIYMVTIGGGQESLALLEESVANSVISVISSVLPTSMSDPIVSAIESYRGPESVTGFSIVESAVFMTLAGILIVYPVFKRSAARFVLTANMGAREFREETGILVEEISQGSEDSFEEPEYVMGDDKSELDEDVEVVTVRDDYKMDTEEDSQDLIALPDHIKGSPFAEYEEVRRYWVRAPYAYVSIVYNERQNDYRYVVVEPELDETEKVLFDELKTRLDNVLLFEDVEEYEDNEKEVQSKLKKLERRMIELTEEYEIDINDETFHRLMYYIERDYVYYNKIDPLINDPNVEDISCDGEDQYIFVFHTDYKDVITNIKFEKNELRSFIQELAQRSGEHISAADPMVDASLPDGSRAQMTLGSEVTTRGSTFTIRLFEDIPFTPVDLLDYDTFSITQMAYLWTAIENNKSLIFAGGTASGKTTSMNAVSMFIPPKAKVITIEDTREISLPQKNWIPGTTREGVGGEEGGDDIDMYELLRAALRQRPEYIVVGEIRGREAETLFQAMNTGHTTYSTMHAETVDAAIGRLTNPPINVPKQMITALDIICIQNQIRFTDEDGNQINVRRNEETREIVSLRENGQFENRRPFQWDAETDTFIESLEDSHVLERVANENGWTPKDKREELEQREEVLEYMLENNIREFDYVTNIIQAYMVDSEKIITEVREDTLDPDNLKSLTDMEWESPEVDPETTLNEQITEPAPETKGDNK